MYSHSIIMGNTLSLAATNLGINLTTCLPPTLCAASSGNNGDDVFIGGGARRERDDPTEIIRTMNARQLNYQDFLTRLQEMDRLAQTQFVTEHFEGHNDDPKLGPEYINTVISRGPALRLVSVAIKYYDASFNPAAYARSPGEVAAFALLFHIDQIRNKFIVQTKDVSTVRALQEAIISTFCATGKAQDVYDWLHEQLNAMSRTVKK